MHFLPPQVANSLKIHRKSADKLLARRTRSEFASFADARMLSPMNSSFENSAKPLIVKVWQLFSRDLAFRIVR